MGTFKTMLRMLERGDYKAMNLFYIQSHPFYVHKTYMHLRKTQISRPISAVSGDFSLLFFFSAPIQ